MDRLLTAKEVAQRLSVNLGTVYDWVAQGYLPHVCLSEGSRKRCIRFDESELETWLKQRTNPGRVDRLAVGNQNARGSGCASGAREGRQ